MIKITFGKSTFNAPEKWEECTEKQISSLIVLSVLKVLPATAWVSVLQICLGASDRFMRRLVLSSDQFEELKRQFSWIFNERVSSFTSDRFEFKGVKYFYPADGFDNTTAEELSLGAMYFTNLAEGSKGEDIEEGFDASNNLEQLLAVFCRPARDIKETKLAGWNGDYREPYYEHASLVRAELFLKLPVQIKLVFLQWFETHFTKFLDDYEQVFGGQKKGQRRYADGRGWPLLLKNVAKQGYLGHLANVQRTNVHEVWSYLMDDVIDINEQKDGDKG